MSNNLGKVINNLNKVKSILIGKKFQNPFATKNVGLKEVYDYLKQRKKYPIIPLTEYEKKHIHPVLKPDFDLINSKYDHNKEIVSTWLGHSTCLVQIEGYNLMIDPVFSKYITPFPLLPVGPERITEPACKISEIKTNIDFIVISHIHYDHLDKASILEINKLHKPKQYFVPLGVKKWFEKNGIHNVTEMDWWEEVKFNNDLTIVYTPANHHSQRGLFDKGEHLWGGFIVKGKNKNFYYSGDTAYHGDLFKSIGHHYGPFDFSILPIGAYDQYREFMKHHHCDPKEAVSIHKDINSKKSFGCHWGTFILSTEPILEPPKLLKQESEVANLGPNEFFTTKIGETSIIKD